MRGEADILKALKMGLESVVELPMDVFVGTPLWFLYYLLLISLSVLLMRYLFAQNKHIQDKLTQIADSTIRWLCNSRLGILLVAIPTAGCLWFMNHWGIDTPDKALTPQVPTLLVYGGFFFFGWLLQRQAALMEHFSRLSWDKFVLCLIAMIVTNLLSSYEMNLGHPQYILIKIIFILCYAIMMWSLVSLTLGLFKRFLDRPSKTIRYVADSSYWLYLIHFPIVVWLQIALAEFSLHWSIKLAIICGLTVFISMVLYEAFVRSTFIGKVLNGKRKLRLLSNLN